VRIATRSVQLVNVCAFALLVLAAVIVYAMAPGKHTAFGGSFVIDDFARVLKILTLTGSARHDRARTRLSRRREAGEVRVLDPDPAVDHRHADADLGGRPDRALSRPRADEPRALRGRGERPRQRALDRGRA
jgi:hypothetical protein